MSGEEAIERIKEIIEEIRELLEEKEEVKVPPAQPIREGHARTAKNLKGAVQTCVSESDDQDSDLPEEYRVLHNLVHAQQLCNLPPGAGLYDSLESSPRDDREVCCAREMEAYVVTCNAIAEDSHFDGTNILIYECASVLADKVCSDVLDGTQGETCLNVPYTVSDGGGKDIYEKIIEAAKGDNGSQSINYDNLPARHQRIKDSLALVCSPTCRTRYRNSIGNNACYLGQCIEQSIEYARILPGRMAFTVQDQAYPWDAKVETDSDNAAFLSAPVITDPVIPAYKMEKLFLELDKAFCQSYGMPLLAPPSRCANDPRRRMQLSLDEYFPMAEGFINQPSQHFEPIEVNLNMLPSVGARIGARFFVNYFHEKAREFAQLVKMANSMLKEYTEIEFPTSMCPRYDQN